MLLSPQSVKKSITKSFSPLIELTKFYHKENISSNSIKNKSYLDSRNIHSNLKNLRKINQYKKKAYNDKKIVTFIPTNNPINKNKFRFLSNYNNIYNNNYSTTTNTSVINNNISANFQNFSIYNYLITNNNRMNSSKIFPTTKNLNQSIASKFYSTKSQNSRSRLKNNSKNNNHIILSITNNNLKDAKNIYLPLSPTYPNKKILLRHGSDGNILSLKQMFINKNKLLNKATNKYLNKNLNINNCVINEYKNKKNKSWLNVSGKYQAKYIQILSTFLTKRFDGKNNSRSESKTKSKSRSKTKSFIKKKSITNSNKKSKNKNFICIRKISPYNTKKDRNLICNNQNIKLNNNEIKNDMIFSVEETHFSGVLFYQNIKKYNQLLD